jgi:hypothetical protein
MMLGRLEIALVVAVAAFACGPRKKQTETPRTTSGTEVDAGFVDKGPGVSLNVEPQDAFISIDGRSLGTLAEMGGPNGFVKLEPGLHQIVVRKPGFRTWRAEVTVRDKSERIHIVLEPASAPQ